MPRPTLEVADIFRDHGAAWRKANAGHVSLDQIKVMSATSRAGPAMIAVAYAGGLGLLAVSGVRRSKGLMIARITLVATCV